MRLDPAKAPAKKVLLESFLLTPLRNRPLFTLSEQPLNSRLPPAKPA